MAAAGTLYASPASALLADPFVRSIARTDPCAGVPPLPDEALPAEPFRYLERYQAGDASLFFGRCRELKAIIHALEGDRRIILLYGQSGVGKSSLLEAGVEPRLRRRYDIRATRRTRERGLAGDLRHALGVPGASAAQLDVAWAALEATRDARPLVILLDQVEETWTRERTGDSLEPRAGRRDRRAVRGAVDPLRARLRRDACGAVVPARSGCPRSWHSALKRWACQSAGVRIAPLDFDAIEEIVLGIPRTPRLADTYGLRVAPPRWRAGSPRI